MKKTITILLMLLTFAVSSQSLILTEDTVIPHDENYTTVRTNGFNLHVQGSLITTSFILLNGGGTITATDDIIVGSNIFFLDDNGTVQSQTGINVGNDTTGSGTIIYCTFYNSPIIGENINVTQDCSLSIPLSEYIKNIPIGEEFYIMNELGQIIDQGVFKSNKDIYSIAPNRFIYFPRLKYGDRMIFKLN